MRQPVWVHGRGCILLALMLVLLAPFASAASSACTGLGVPPLSLTPTLPTQFIPLGAQLGADCMAWQSFIALNWAADPNNPGYPDKNAPASAFGTPGDTTATVWQSYLPSSVVFNPPSRARHTLWSTPRSAVIKLSQRSEAGPTDLSLSGILQAGSNKWLTDQSGGLAYYEVHINQDEFEFIKGNVFSGSDLTTFAGQAACAGQPGQGGRGGFNLPGGGGTTPTAMLDTDCTGKPAIYGQNVGAIEVKAAWVALPPDHSLDYRYKTAVATITDPFGKQSTATVGLVGLHIIHKVPNAQQFVWATFEQIDNTPDDAGASFSPPVLPPNPNQKPSSGYTFFNTQCTAAGDPTYQCQHNKLPGTPCDASGQPAGCYPYTAPMQITRMVTVDSVANSVTGSAWNMLPADSVFNYYRLVNVQWPNGNASVPPGSHTPLPRGDITPPSTAGIVANTTLETFEQTKNACMDCHQGAPIAQASQQKRLVVAGRSERVVQLQRLLAADAPLASDYSFLFVTDTVQASAPAARKAVACTRRSHRSACRAVRAPHGSGKASTASPAPK